MAGKAVKIWPATVCLGQSTIESQQKLLINLFTFVLPWKLSDLGQESAGGVFFLVPKTSSYETLAFTMQRLKKLSFPDSIPFRGVYLNKLNIKSPQPVCSHHHRICSYRHNAIAIESRRLLCYMSLLACLSSTHSICSAVKLIKY